MKKTVLAVMVMVFLFCAAAHAGNTVTFAWDPNPVEQGVTGYRVYQGTTSGAYNKATGKVCDVSGTTCTVKNIPDGTYFWVATAYDAAGNESAYSNEVTKVLDATAPTAPGGFKVTITVNVSQ